MSTLAYINGKLIPRKKAMVSIDDHGFLYGDGIYETLRVYNGRPFQLKEHLARLKHSADGIGLKLPLSLLHIGRALERTVRANRHQESVVRLTVSRGPGPYGFDPRPCKNPTLVIVSYPFTPYPETCHRDGISVAIVPTRRNNPLSLPPHVKSTSCMNGVLAKRESLRLGVFEGVMLTHDGFLAEGTVSNVFLVQKGMLKTPSLNGTLLAGVTRQFVLGLAQRLGLRAVETRLRLADVVRADELFLSNTTMEVMPIQKIVLQPSLKIRPRILKKKAPGPLTIQLMQAFRNARLGAL